MSRLITAEFLELLIDQAGRSVRRRQHFNLHEAYADPCQRLLNAIMPDSYIRPHRHSCDPKRETLIALRGGFGVLVFDDAGVVVTGAVIGREGTMVVEVEPGEWHTVIALTEGAVLLEVKAGPFHPAAAKEMAPWAPAEGTPAAAAYLEHLRDNLR